MHFVVLISVTIFIILHIFIFHPALAQRIIVTVYLLTHGIFLLSFFCRTHILFGMCSYDWVHCLILLSPSNSSFIEL